MTENKTSIIVSGGLGRMGQAILRLALGNPDLKVEFALESPEKVQSSGGKTLVAGVEVPLFSDLAAGSPRAGAILVEFTTPEATLKHLQAAAELGLKMVIGTTGLTQADTATIARAAEKTSIVLSSNMSVGVNALAGLVGRLAAMVPDYDIEIVEMHHRLKKDAPSGTAILLGRAAAEARGKKLEDVATYGREGMVGERPAGEIGIHAVRGGDVVGEHTVTFATEGERIELVHRAHSRDTFAAGALRAARWLANKERGLYNMRDVLGL